MFLIRCMKKCILSLKFCFLGFNFQATIGIDFLSKTMYLEDRTVSKMFFVLTVNAHAFQCFKVTKCMKILILCVNVWDAID